MVLAMAASMSTAGLSAAVLLHSATPPGLLPAPSLWWETGELLEEERERSTRAFMLSDEAFCVIPFD